MSGFRIRNLPFLTSEGRVVGVIGSNGNEIMLPTFSTDGTSLLKPDGSLFSGGGGAVAAITGSYAVGQVLTASFPPSTIGTIQFTRTLAVAPFTKSLISGAVASAVNSLTYTVTSSDAGYAIGVDCSNQVSSTVGGVIAAAGGVVTTPAASTVNMVVFAGQSQANSNGNTSAQTVPTAISGPMTDVYIWDPFGKAWLTYQAQVTSAAHLKGGLYPDTSQNYFGAEAEYARRWKVDNPGVPLYMVKKAHSTTSLSQLGRTDGRGCWDPGLRGDLYDEFLSWMSDAKSNLVASGKTVSIRGMNWIQGENDAGSTTSTADAANAYAVNLAAFIDALRAANVLASTTPFVISRIQTSSWKYPAIVRAAQVSVAETKAYCRWADADPVAIDGNDTVHYGPNGVVTLGDILYDEGMSGIEAAKQYAAKMTVAPSADRVTKLGAFFDSLINNNIWSSLSTLQIYASPTEQAALLNARNFPVTATNSGMTFTADQGFTGTSTASFINTGVNPATGNTRLEPNSVAYGFYIRGNIASTGVDMGYNVVGSPAAATIIGASQSPGVSTGTFRINVSTTSADNTYPAVTDVSGLWSGSRTAANAQALYFRGAQIGTTDSVNTTVGEGNQPIFIGNRNSSNGTSGTNGTLRQYGMFIAGRGRTPAQETALNSAVISYLSAIGAN